MLFRQAVRDGLEAEGAAIACFHVSLDGGGVEEAALDVLGDDESDIDLAEAEKLSELEHGVDGALEREREYQHMGTHCWIGNWLE